MRNDFTPQVETREIADSDLDNVSGGLLDGVVYTVESVLPVKLPLVDTAAGLVGGLGL
jgi:hypothetical protein